MKESTLPTSPSFKTAQDVHEFLGGVGYDVIKIAVSAEVFGWTKPQHGIPYVHTDHLSPARDLVMWCAGNAAAEARMRGLAQEWAPAVMDEVGRALVPSETPGGAR